MELKLLGTAACEGIPASFCSCEICKRSQRLGGKNLRARSQMLIDNDMLIDFPADTYQNFIKNKKSLIDIKYLLVTHPHADHFYPQELINRGGLFSAATVKDKLVIVCPKGVKDFFVSHTKFMIPKVCDDLIEWITLQPFEKINCGLKSVTLLPAIHMEDNSSCGIYLISSESHNVLYATDTYEITKETIDFLSSENIKLNCLILDGTQGANAADKMRHMNASGNVDAAQLLLNSGIINSKTKIIATHFSHNGGATHPDLVKLFKNLTKDKAFKVVPAFDGLKVSLHN